MIHRLATHLATSLALAGGVAVVNYWWLLAISLTLAAVPVLYVAERTSDRHE